MFSFHQILNQNPTIFGIGVDLYKYYSQFGEVPAVLIGIAIMLFVGFLVTRITKLLKLPNVTAYILAGVLLGPWCLGALSPSVVSHMSFLTDFALSIIAFGVGRYFKIADIKATGKKSIVIAIMESFLAGVLVTLVIGFAFPDKGWTFALLLGSIATATAPASTMMTIRQYGAKGNFVNVLLQVVSLDDATCLIFYTLAITIIKITNGATADVLSIVMPIVWNVVFIGVGLLFGWIHSLLMNSRRSMDNRLILTVAMLLTICGVCSLPMINISPLMACMVFGASYVNFRDDQTLFTQLDSFAPPIMTIFFVMSGYNMDFSQFAIVGLIGVIYFLVRMVGKYAGAYLGCKMVKTDNKTAVNLGFALVPQAGVAIGLAVLGQRMLIAAGQNDLANEFFAIIICSSVLYEMVGPGLAKLALIKSGAIPSENLKVGPKTLSRETEDLRSDGHENTVPLEVETLNPKKQDVPLTVPLKKGGNKE